MPDRRTYDPAERGCAHTDCRAARAFSGKLARFIQHDEDLMESIGTIMKERDVAFAEAVLFALIPLRRAIADTVVDDHLEALTEELDQLLHNDITGEYDRGPEPDDD